MAAQAQDPFYSVRDNVSSQLERIKVKSEKFQDMVKTTNTAINVDFKDLRKGLFKDLRTVDKELRGLKGAVDMIEKNRMKFPHIEDRELSNRKGFVEDSTNTLSGIKGQMDSIPVRQKMEADEKLAKSNESKGYGDNSGVGAMREDINRENDRFVGEQRMSVQQTIDQQDQNLDDLGRSVDRLGQIGRDINTEVKEQNVLLDKLDEEIDESAERMNVVQEALQKLLNTKDACQIWTIVILGVILILLIALVIWT